ncbi:hypothetical protein JAAARDRAFT_133941 [Jaapia argillacea MUCL 33604]|uniref:Uncharacterized protein n=1 Tax=Jaapia argillacea MUCL 33604 TaxID=933084 RepID=A0A067PKU0_9AGAM|nr:hypothetical protein JAAARDRAFT_133941 [Jaapia argillacea MUCL 33604]
MHTQSIADMPVRGSKKAPHTFRGSSSYVNDFIEEYEALCVQNSVAEGREKCTTIWWYCDGHVRSVIEALTSYATHNWTALCKDILKLYDYEEQNLKYKERDLRKFS